MSPFIHTSCHRNWTTIENVSRGTFSMTSMMGVILDKVASIHAYRAGKDMVSRSNDKIDHQGQH